MKRRTLDVVFSVGGLLLAVLILVLGLVLQNQASFAKDYVRDQLRAQQITFTPEDRLTDAERSEPGAKCLETYAGEQLTTGAQAECYANKYIALHLSEINGGRTYSQTSDDQRAAQAAATSARDSGATNAAQLQSTADALNSKVQTLFRGETLRGLLLTSFGFSIFGERAAQAALVCFIAAGVLVLAALAGLLHAFTTPEDERILVP